MSAQAALLQLLFESLERYNEVMLSKLNLPKVALSKSEIETILTPIAARSGEFINAIEYSIYKSVSETIKTDIKLELLMELDVKDTPAAPADISSSADSIDINFDFSSTLDSIYGKFTEN